MVATSELSTVLGVRHLNHVAGACGLDEDSPHTENETTAHQHGEVLASSLEDGSYNTNERPDSHSHTATIAIGAWSGKEGAGNVANDIECSYETLVLGCDSKIFSELRNGRKAAYIMIVRK